MLKDKGDKNTIYQFVAFNLWVQICLKMREHKKKIVLKWKIEVSLYTLYWDFKKIPFTLYTCVLAKALQNGANCIQKLTPGFTSHMRNLNYFRQVSESQKSWNLMDVRPKSTFLQLKYIQWIYLTLLVRNFTKLLILLMSFLKS